MGPENLRRGAAIATHWILSIACSVLFVTSAVSQAKPEKQSKAVKPTQPASTAAPAASSSNGKSDDDESAKPEEKLFKGMKYRLIGPFRGGRSLTAAGVPGDPTIYYFGATGGGVWKSTNSGRTWAPIFDSQPIASIGAIAVAPSNPAIVYVGSGEADMRSQISYGNGVYKSTDAGRTWSHLGLDGTRQIGRVLVDPKNPNIVFVAALGHAYGANPDRGLFR